MLDEESYYLRGFNRLFKNRTYFSCNILQKYIEVNGEAYT